VPLAAVEGSAPLLGLSIATLSARAACLAAHGAYDLANRVDHELSYSTPKLSQDAFGLEVRPIAGVRKGDREFIVNPIVDIGTQADFAPCARLARKLDKDFFVGLEYYADFGWIWRR
jgi:hypothetical protein